MRTISFKLLYGLVIRAREKIRVSVTTNPTAEWIAGQVTEAFPWNEAPQRLTRDRDRSFGPAYPHRIRAMGIHDHPTAPRSPWQNGYVERLIGSIRCECLDHMVVFGEADLRLESLRLVLQSGPHSSILEQRRSAFPTQPNGRRHRGNPILGGLHHLYVRV